MEPRRRDEMGVGTGKLASLCAALAFLATSSLVACALLLTFAAAPREALASQNANWGAGVQAPLPANAAPSPRVTLRSVSCASPGNCGAVGEYTDSSDERQGLLLSETAGVWGTVEPGSRVPSNAISCPSAGDCTTVGGDEVLSETGGVWGSAAEVKPPVNAASIGHLSYVACSSAGNCTAAGGYKDSSGHYEGLLVTETNGTWGTGVEASLPANVEPETSAYIEGLSCASPGNCAAVGEYRDGAVNEPEIFLLIETEGTWGTAAQAGMPANAEPKSNTIVEGVSCGSVGNCAVVGEYFDSSEDIHGFLLDETEGTWGTAVEARLPANANSNPGPFIEEVQCASAGNCTAVGSYIDSLGNTQGLLLTETSGTWNTGVEAPLPAGARSGPRLLGGSLSCPAAGDCSYVDGYYDSSEHSEGLLLTESQGAWAPALQAALPLNAGAEPETLLRSVSCASPGHCTAVGEYTDSSGHQQGLLLTAAPTTANLSASGPLAGAFAGSAIPTSSISATLDGGSAPSGTVTFTVFGPQSSPPSLCASGGTVVGTASASGDGTYHPSASFTPPSPGEYWWYASYSGDAGDEPAASACGALMAKTLVAPAPTTGLGGGPGTGSSPGSGSSSASGAGSGTGAKTPAPTLSGAKLDSKKLTGKKRIALKLTLSQPATITVLIAQNVEAHKLRGVCEPTARRGKRCTTEVKRRILTFSGTAGSNTFKLRLAGLGEGSYTATITARNVTGESNTVRLTFTIVHK